MDGTVSVDGGWIRGREDGGIWEFLGVPYARAPVGPLRWRPPERPEPWSGVRDATMPGPLAPQVPPAPGATLPGDPLEQSEDCLHLSIWTPAPDSARRPVLVWVHGGGFTSGSAGSVLYRGQRLAAEGDVVVVNINYRLGALGFLAHRGLASGGGVAGSGVGNGGIAGNWALLDQIAALRWVRDHISSFGGDPSKVTVFGESAGAMCLSTLLAVPAAQGLFTGAVIQSGPPYVHRASRAEEAAVSFVRELGMSEVSRAALEAVPAGELVSALAALARHWSRPGELPQPLLPVVDGTILPAAPFEAIARGSASRVATIVGTNRDEMSFFALNDRLAQGMDEEVVRRRIERSAPWVPADRVVDHYVDVLTRRGERAGPRELWVAVGSDLVFRWPSLRLAAALRAHDPRTYVYLFTWGSPAFGGILGATHALEIPFVFGTHSQPGISSFVVGGETDGGHGDAARRRAPGNGQAAGVRAGADALSDAMRASWLSFARSGDPSNPLVGRWPSWDRERRATMVFGETISIEEAPRNDELAVWEVAAPLTGSITEP
ncbi:MAG: carboxylesterase/lipase family protein [Acidimicrobiales bacterium]